MDDVQPAITPNTQLRLNTPNGSRESRQRPLYPFLRPPVSAPPTNPTAADSTDQTGKRNQTRRFLGVAFFAVTGALVGRTSAEGKQNKTGHGYGHGDMNMDLTPDSIDGKEGTDGSSAC